LPQLELMSSDFVEEASAADADDGIGAWLPLLDVLATGGAAAPTEELAESSDDDATPDEGTRGNAEVSVGSCRWCEDVASFRRFD
jgi:hypothetical protein